MYSTKNDLPEGSRRTICEMLNSRLAEAIDIGLQAKQAHWNVKGSSFYALHKLFDEIAEGVQEHVDDIAERLVQLGGIAEGTISALEKRSKLPEYPLTIADGVEHLTVLQNSIAQFAEAVRKAIDEAAETPDADTADLMTEVSRAMDKYLWLIEAHLQANAADVYGVGPKRSDAA